MPWYTIDGTFARKKHTGLNFNYDQSTNRYENDPQIRV